jgi:hypothetical protein
VKVEYARLWLIRSSNPQLPPLYKSLSLIATLCVFFPDFCRHFLSQPNQESTDLLALLQRVVSSHAPQSQLQPTYKGKEKEEISPAKMESEAVVLAALDALNALTFGIQSEGINRMEALLLTVPSILMTLTEHRNTPRVLASTVEWALTLVSEKQFFRTLLSLATTSQPLSHSRNGSAASRIPLVDRLASLLAYHHDSLSFEDTVALHLNVMNVLGSLTLAHEDAVTLMGESGNLLPKIIACISNDTTLLYESDGQGLAALYPKL